MFAPLTALRKATGRAAALLGLVALASCSQVTLPGPGSGGPTVDASRAVPVALLVPTGAGGGGGAVGQALENAARLAVSDTEGNIDLRVYDTQGTPAGATSAAHQALSDGAQIILGPLYSQSIGAVAPLVSGQQINVLAFSNNPAVAGGNVFILGPTFRDVADRLTSYSARQGRRRLAVVHADDVAGQAGRDAIVAASRSAGIDIATIQSYPLSQQGIVSSSSRISEAVSQSGADALFLTANVDTDLPLLATRLPEAGVSPGQVQYLGLTRWSSAPQALSLPGLQGGLFTLPDQQAVSTFETRYQQAYGNAPHPLAGLGYDAVSAVSTLIGTGRSDALSSRQLARNSGFQGAYGAFRLRPDGTNDRALAVAQIQNNEVVVLDPAPSGFGGAGF